MALHRWIPLWSIPCLVVFAVATVWLRLSIVRTSYRIDETDRMIRDLKRVQELSELKLASMRSPRRLELLARSRFGLQPPRAEQVVHLK
jgi:hypothetical protein